MKRHMKNGRWTSINPGFPWAGAVGRHYGLGRLRINLTNDDLPDMIESRSPKEAGPAYFRLFRSHGMAPERAPDTCWLDRI